MSLTTLLQKQKARDLIDEVAPETPPNASKSIKSEWRTRNYMVVGTAMDYLLRFWLEREECETRAKGWVAHEGMFSAMVDGWWLSDGAEKEELADTANDRFIMAEQRHAEFVDGGDLTDDLVRSAFDLARMDFIYRGDQVTVEDFERGVDDEDLIDCKLLLATLAESDLAELVAREGVVVHLNPIFGAASHLVGGADADLVVETPDEVTLIDLKTTGDSRFKRDYWRQLVGYATLLDLAPASTGLPSRANRVGVYFVRHGELVSAPTTFYEAEEYDSYREEFVELAVETFEPDRSDVRALYDGTGLSFVRGLLDRMR